MDALRRLVKRPQTYYGALTLLVALLAWDTSRHPGDQVSARLFVGAVRTYQDVLGPVMTRAVQCRYRPTCSEYSIEAVQRLGIRRGPALAARRVLTCGPRVPPGTPDPVPPAAGAAP